jgi:tRNA pseudouridine synthase 8/2,5-diamino-6-(5-phospho-D-ribitylamino)-pyrimidin-4(3H)-one deaminase
LFRDREIRKIYLANIKGNFKEELIEVDLPLYSNLDKDLNNNKILKTSKTIFKRISYNPKENTTLISCHPLTGIFNLILIN